MLPPISPQQQEAALLVKPNDSLVIDSKRIVKGDEVSYFHLIENAESALRWRLAMFDSAQSSIDMQTFMWEDDRVGALLFDRVLRAAERGVKVRVLIDDVWLKSNEALLASYERSPNISIRLYNPSRVRSPAIGRGLYFLTHYSSMNHRLHSKVLIADGVWSLSGGRNVGDKYFGLSDKYNFRDLDVLSTGGVVSEMRQEFDLFWNSAYVYPARYLQPKVDASELAESTREIRRLIQDDAELKHLPPYPFLWDKQAAGLRSKMVPGKAIFIADVPGGRDRVMEEYLSKHLYKAANEVVIVTPYFIPYKASFEELEEVITRGVRVKIVVPSLGANNHLITHSHYRKYRKKLLSLGCEIYEYRHDPDEKQRALSNSSSVVAPYVCLHKKAIIADRRYCYIGSLNMDPRALNINAESGLIIDSEPLAQKLAQQVEEMTQPRNAWRVVLDEKKEVRWLGESGRVLQIQPSRTKMQRFWDAWARWIPIESEL